MISTDGWVDWAERLPGPASKVYPDYNKGQGFVNHSAEGEWTGTMIELQKPDREASWTFTNARGGKLFQHYSIYACPWASGAYQANIRYVAMESIGLEHEPLDDGQRATAIRLWRELGFTIRGVNLFEHREMAALYGARATACPSNRYDEAYEEMALEDRVKALELALSGGVANVLEDWNAQGNSLIIGYNKYLYPHITDAEGIEKPHSTKDHQHYMPEQASETGGLVQ